MSGYKEIDEHKYESLCIAMSSVSDGVIIVDTQKDIVFINESAQRLTGWDEAEAIGKPFDTVFNLLNFKTREKADCLFTRVMSSGEKAGFSDYSALISKSGSERYISASASPIKNEDGHIQRIIITFLDITHYKKIEEELKIERNNLKTQFQYAPAGMVIVDENTVIQSANDRFTDMFQSSKENVIGKKIGKSLECAGAESDICREGEKCEKCSIRECVLKVIESRIPSRGVEKRFTLINKCNPVYRDLKFNIVPISISGKVYAMLSVDDMTEYRTMEENLIRDITIRKDTEQALRDSEEKYRAIFQNAPYAIFLYEMTNFIEVNNTACELLGYTREELLNLSPGDIVCGGLDGISSDDTGQMITNEHLSYETVYKTKDGREIPVEISSHAFELSGRKVNLTIANDISERKQIELDTHMAMEATNAAFKAKSEFLANMSHEIRTPLNGILGMLELTMLADLSDEQMDNLSTAKECANSLHKIINDVLDFSKMEAGKMTIEHTEFDFRALMEKIIKIHTFQAKEKGIELINKLPVNLPSFLIGDPNRLQQVLNNLLSNAVKFTDKGSVSLNVEVADHIDGLARLRFSIDDTGIGISADDMSRLFKSFSQIDGSQTRKFGGTGLGLVISRQLVEMMGGTLKVESEKNKGSSFSFSLRFKVASRINATTENRGLEAIGKTKTNAKILLVEDDKVNQMVISRMLKEMGYRFDVAGCGNDALKLLEGENYDLCLMDIQMPVLDGVQTVGLIRTNEQGGGRHMPIIAITAHMLQGDRERYLKLGMDEYLAKPFQMLELFSLIEKLLVGNIAETGQVFSEAAPGKPIDIEELNSYIKNYVSEIKPVIQKIHIDIDRLRKSVKTADLQVTEDIAHEVKMLASSISAENVKVMAFRIELAARRGNRPETVNLCEELDTVFKKYSNSINER